LPKITDENQIVLNLGVTLNRLDKMDEKSFSGITIQLPQTSVRAVSSTVKMNSGQTIVIGGILSDTVNDETTKVPLLGDIPILGNLFKYKKNEVTKTEMVIVISAHVIDLS
jgi:type II secretory pathway component GspD/PulD (secretin)